MTDITIAAAQSLLIVLVVLHLLTSPSRWP